MKPDRVDAVLCRVYEARKALRDCARAARRGDLSGSQLEAHMAKLAARAAHDVADERNDFTHTEVVTSRPRDGVSGGTSWVHTPTASYGGDLRLGLKKAFG